VARRLAGVLVAAVQIVQRLDSVARDDDLVRQPVLLERRQRQLDVQRIILR